MPPAASASETLVTPLLLRLFSPQELRAVVMSMPSGRDVLDGIPDRASPAEFAATVVSAHDRRGLLPELLRYVRAERPRATDELAKVEHSLSGERTASGRLREAALRALSAPGSQPYLGSSTMNTLVTWGGGRMFLLWPITEGEGRLVSVDDLRLALSSEVPVLLVAGEGECTAWRWADAKLVETLAEAAGARVPVPFSRPQGTLRAFVEQTIATFERPRWRWEPEAWGRLQARAAELGREVRKLGADSGSEAALQVLDAATRRIEDARFIVAVAGPFRAGKSTLINALLEVAVSPVSRRPTTAVTVEFEDGTPPRAEVIFADGTRVAGGADHTFLQTYATQEANRNNQRNVRLVQVRVPSPLLAQGVVLLDAPGLQDPNDTMIRIADEALTRAHAVLYIVDGAPFADGGFVLNREIVGDIRRIGHRAGGRKIILVVNKTDKLTADQADELFHLLIEQLADYSLADLLHGGPLLVSAETAWGRVAGKGDGDGGLEAVRAALWEELLQHGEVGFRQLREAVRSLEQATGDVTTLLSARRVRGAEVARLRAWVRDATGTVAQVHADLRQAEARTIQFGREELARVRAAAVGRVSAWLRSHPDNQNLPDAERVAGELETALASGANFTWTTVSSDLAEAEAQAALAIETELRQARIALEPTSARIGLTTPAVHISFAADTGLRQGLGGGIASSLLGALFGATPAGMLVSGIVGFFATLFSSRAKRRAEDLGRLDAELEAKASEVERVLQQQLSEHVQSRFSEIRRRVDDRLGAFVAVISERTGGGEAPGITDAEAGQFAGYEQRANSLRTELGSLVDEVFRAGMQSIRVRDRGTTALPEP